MRVKLFIPTLVAVAAIAAAALAQTAPPASFGVAWDPNPAADSVTGYKIAHRPKGATNWSEITVAGNTTVATIPANPYATEVRAQAINAFGASEWTPVATLPASVKALRFTIEVTP